MDKISSTVTGVQIEIDGQVVLLSMTDARKIYDELAVAFGQVHHHIYVLDPEDVRRAGVPDHLN